MSLLHKLVACQLKGVHQGSRRDRHTELAWIFFQTFQASRLQRQIQFLPSARRSEFDDFLSLDALPSEFLHGDDGSELLTGAFADLLSPEAPESTARAPSSQHVVPTAGELHPIASRFSRLM